MGNLIGPSFPSAEMLKITKGLVCWWPCMKITGEMKEMREKGGMVDLSPALLFYAVRVTTSISLAFCHLLPLASSLANSKGKEWTFRRNPKWDYTIRRHDPSLKSWTDSSTFQFHLASRWLETIGRIELSDMHQHGSTSLLTPTQGRHKGGGGLGGKIPRARGGGSTVQLRVLSSLCLQETPFLPFYPRALLLVVAALYRLTSKSLVFPP